jgi:gliding motility-associated-like protein
MLSISGVAGSQCEFNIKVLEGIGTASPGPVSCTCTSGGVDGPGHICSYDPAIYSVAVPNCFFSFGLPVGGNGEYCPPPGACPSILDSVVLEWHIPSMMRFVGDSTGWDVQIAVDSNYMSLDTLFQDSIWLSWQLVSSIPLDTLSFCECSDLACEGGIVVLPVSIGYETIKYFCTLTCAEPTCLVDGITYDTPGSYTYEPTPCVKVLVTITQEEPTPIISGTTICEGAVAILAVANIKPDYTYQWNNGGAGPTLSVAPGTTTTYIVTATHSSGNCVYSSAATVTVLPVLEEQLGEVGVISCADPCFFFQGQNYCVAGNYTIQTGLCTTQFFSIGADPTLFQENLPPVDICEGDCYDFFGQQICSSMTATHVANCTTYVQQITVNPTIITNHGIVGAVSCSEPCFSFEGTDYCAPGQYTKSTVCGTETFEIVFEKTLVNFGEVGELNCNVNCVDFGGQEYCQPGTYTLEDSCTIRQFNIVQNTLEPVCSEPFHDCLPSNTHFTVAFSIEGLPPYKVNGSTLPSNYFVSSPQANSEQYVFIVEHANGCQTVVTGIFDCSLMCISDAGKLAADTLHGCAGQSSVQIQSLESPTLAPNDVEVYTLQTDDGMVLALNSTGNFEFDPSTMTLGETYLAIRSVGPPDANGIPDMANACTDTSSTQPVVFHALPNVMLSGDSSLCETDTVILTATGALSYLWMDGSTGVTFEIEMANPDNSGNYSVVGTDINGCFAADSMYVEVHPQQSPGCCEPQLPDAFTPNGDGANDSFIPLLQDCSKLEFAEMRIYSRWGELVFKSHENSARWDGLTPSGTPASSDTYVFTFRYRLEGDEEKTQKGEITLLR